MEADASVEGHPVVHEGCVFIPGASQDTVPLLVVDLEHAGVGGSGLVRDTGDAGGLHHLAAVLVQGDMLIPDVHFHVVQAVTEFKSRVRLKKRNMDLILRHGHFDGCRKGLRSDFFRCRCLRLSLLGVGAGRCSICRFLFLLGFLLFLFFGSLLLFLGFFQFRRFCRSFLSHGILDEQTVVQDSLGVVRLLLSGFSIALRRFFLFSFFLFSFFLFSFFFLSVFLRCVRGGCIRG